MNFSATPVFPFMMAVKKLSESPAMHIAARAEH